MAGEGFDRYKGILDKARNEKLQVLNTWYSLFKLKEDPFAREIPDEEIDSYFIDRENIIENIIFDIGVASRGIPIIILIVAPTGFGKSSLLKYIHHIITKIASTDKEKYSFKGKYMPAEELFDIEEREGEGDTNDDYDTNKDSVQSWIKISKRFMDFILFDDANPNHIRTIIKEFTNTKLKLFAISPINLDQALSIIQYEPKIYFLNQFNYNESMMMLEQRLKMTIQTENKNNNNNKIYDLFDETAIKTIYDCSFGVPRLILECSSKALSLLKSIVIGKPSKPEQQQIQNNNNKRVTSQIAIQACRQSKCQQAKKQYENLSDVRKEIIYKIMFKERSATDIAAEIRKDRTTVSRYLNELKDLDLITFNTHGRETVYKASLPTQILFEIEHMPTVERGKRRRETDREEEELGEGGGREKRHVEA